MSNVYYIKEGIFTQEEINNETKPLNAIKNYCRYACCCNDFESWKECNNKSCFLWHLRLGKNPNRKKVEMTEERREEMSKRMKEMRKGNSKKE